MTFLKQNRISMIAGTSILTIALAFGGYSFASHSFEAGVSGDNIPDNTHILLNGITLEPGDVLPLYDASPNYVSGHFLLTDECVPVAESDDTFRPRVNVIAGHIDESVGNTHFEPMALFFISHASNGENRCVWHAHIPDPLNGGAPKVTDIFLYNGGESDVVFSGQHIVDINIQSVLGNIGSNPYTETVADFGENPIYDLNDEDHTNDGLGHSSGGGH
ncbi:MAG: hypothetical protein ACE5DU_06965 [Nitrosopumilus sp.]